MPKVNGDFVASLSGASHIGVDGNINGNADNAFDADSISPFGHIIQLSGVFVDPLYGQSGVLRFALPTTRFEVSVDGGATFLGLRTTADTRVDSIGVIGDTNLTGDVDLASTPSGFIAIEDTANASPIQFSVDTLGLSGLWDFPSQGFNGSVVNELTDANGTTAQGSLQIVGASGILVDIIGQVVTVTAAAEQVRCHSQSFSSSTSWDVNHGLNTTDVLVQAFDNNNLFIIPDKMEISNANQVVVSFNTPQAGKAVVVGCI
jgi:hypothetical protein